MESLVNIVIIILLWVAIWDLSELLIDKITKNMSDKNNTIFRVVLYVIIIACALYYAKQKGISFT